MSIGTPISTQENFPRKEKFVKCDWPTQIFNFNDDIFGKFSVREKFSWVEMVLKFKHQEKIPFRERFPESKDDALWVCRHRASWTFYLTTVGIEPATFGFNFVTFIRKPSLLRYYRRSKCGSLYSQWKKVETTTRLPEISVSWILYEFVIYNIAACSKIRWKCHHYVGHPKKYNSCVPNFYTTNY